MMGQGNILMWGCRNGCQTRRTIVAQCFTIITSGVIVLAWWKVPIVVEIVVLSAGMGGFGKAFECNHSVSFKSMPKALHSGVIKCGPKGRNCLKPFIKNGVVLHQNKFHGRVPYESSADQVQVGMTNINATISASLPLRKPLSSAKFFWGHKQGSWKLNLVLMHYHFDGVKDPHYIGSCLGGCRESLMHYDVSAVWHCVPCCSMWVVGADSGCVQLHWIAGWLLVGVDIIRQFCGIVSGTPVHWWNQTCSHWMVLRGLSWSVWGTILWYIGVTADLTTWFHRWVSCRGVN